MTEEQTNSPVSTTKPSQPRIWPLWLLLVLVIAALSGLAVYGWLQLEKMKTLNSQFELVQDNTRKAQTSDQEIRGQITQISSRLDSSSEKQNTELVEIKKQLQENANQLLRLGGTSRTEWLLAEAEYLLRLANQRLALEKDAVGAEAILSAADSVLRDSQDAGTYPVREALAKEILSLQTLPNTDKDGLYLKLEAIVQSIDHLEQRLLVKDSDPVRPETTPKPESDSLADKILSKLAKVMVFKNLDRPVEPLLSPEQAYYLKQNLRLMLEQAQLALLKKHQALYEQSLDKAMQWIQEYFLLENAATKALLNQLQQLKKQNINPELPDISESLALLKQRIDSLYRRHAMPEPVATVKPMESAQ
ncbi:putative uroporphyrinogen III methyltransferase [Oleiphilus messinensis]|uniref:Putative uroporphyrinogen III methyltransferase n=1 Tax=Oleiphilus messinensis TaxID=141451 RepID=A0A1Y0I4U5_9GAMM|nr:uroporphyrinogen-III C-methyltransferase [Oleiphilus messinensis]ARU54474.1 putative uroporphyrinogen III methyltransferase [Oleiphilus messinensis]